MLSAELNIMIALAADDATGVGIFDDAALPPVALMFFLMLGVISLELNLSDDCGA